MSHNVQTPRPTPQFYNVADENEFVTKSRTKTKRQMIPKAMRTAPVANRCVDKRFANQRPHAITFKPHANQPDDTFSLLNCPFYDRTRSEAYIEQCFIIRKRLGFGSFGQVFHVTSKEDGRDYAIKCALNIFKSDADRHAKLSEVQKHEQIPAHTNLVGFVRAWEETGRLYIQTELCKTTLDELAKPNQPVPESQLWPYIVDLLLAIKHLHDHNLVHADIKPENIFVSYDNICKLGDFGLVTDVNGGVPRDYPEGDCKYMAPELLQGQFSKSADIFSLGASILELACDLDMPMSGQLWTMLRSNQLPNEHMQSISPGLRKLIGYMMQSSPLLRPSADCLLRSALKFGALSTRRTYHIYRSLMNCTSGYLRTLLLFLGACLMCIWAAIIALPARVFLPYPSIAFNGGADEQQVTPLHHEPAIMLEAFSNSRAYDDEEGEEEDDPRFDGHAYTDVVDRHRNISTGSRHLMPPKALHFDEEEDDEQELENQSFSPQIFAIQPTISPRVPLRTRAMNNSHHRALFRQVGKRSPFGDLSPIPVAASSADRPSSSSSPIVGAMSTPRHLTPSHHRLRPAPMTTPRVRLSSVDCNKAQHAHTISVARVLPMRRQHRMREGAEANDRLVVSPPVHPLKKRRLVWQTNGGMDQGHSPPAGPSRAVIPWHVAEERNEEPRSLHTPPMTQHPMTLRSTPTRQHNFNKSINHVLNESYSPPSIGETGAR